MQITDYCALCAYGRSQSGPADLCSDAKAKPVTLYPEIEVLRYFSNLVIVFLR